MVNGRKSSRFKAAIPSRANNSDDGKLTRKCSDFWVPNLPARLGTWLDCNFTTSASHRSELDRECKMSSLIDWTVVDEIEGNEKTMKKVRRGLWGFGLPHYESSIVIEGKRLGRSLRNVSGGTSKSNHHSDSKSLFRDSLHRAALGSVAHPDAK